LFDLRRQILSGVDTPGEKVVVHIDFDTGAQTVKRISGVQSLDILADKKDVILVTNSGNVTRFTPSTGEEVVLRKLGDFSTYGATFDPTENVVFYEEPRR
jgi:hypothetical protein